MKKTFEKVPWTCKLAEIVEHLFFASHLIRLRWFFTENCAGKHLKSLNLDAFFVKVWKHCFELRATWLKHAIFSVSLAHDGKS